MTKDEQRLWAYTGWRADAVPFAPVEKIGSSAVTPYRLGGAKWFLADGAMVLPEWTGPRRARKSVVPQYVVALTYGAGRMAANAAG